MQSYFDLRSSQYDKGIKDLDVSHEEMPVGLKFKYHELILPYKEDKKVLK